MSVTLITPIPTVDTVVPVVVVCARNSNKHNFKNRGKFKQQARRFGNEFKLRAVHNLQYSMK
jgi:hypothetical protein